jgi:hypothetical protein
VDELIDAVQRQSPCTHDCARNVIAAMLAFLSTRLPSPPLGGARALLDKREPRTRGDNGST